jgi:hypothetical protein
MPVMNGMELLQEMAARDEWRDILRVIISTDGSRPARGKPASFKVSLYEEAVSPGGGTDVLCQIASVDVH